MASDQLEGARDACTALARASTSRALAGAIPGGNAVRWR
jgi:hypothetical protein